MSSRLFRAAGMLDGPKSLYSVLGLAPDAPPAVIKAAYRALAKQYHPDGEGAGDPEAAAKFIELQQAYEVLSDEESRAKYDRELHRAAEEELPEEEGEASINPDEIWAAEARLHPEIESIHETLNAYSMALGNRFRLAVINGECSDNPATYAADLDRAFFRKYFGDDLEIQGIARKLLASGNRRATRVLNKAIQRGKLKNPKQSQRILGVFRRIIGECSGSPDERRGGKINADDFFINPPNGDFPVPRNPARRSAAAFVIPFFMLVVLLGAFAYLSTKRAAEETASPEVEAKAILDRVKPEELPADAAEVSSNPDTGALEPTTGDPVEESAKDTTQVQHADVQEASIVPARHLDKGGLYPEITEDELPYDPSKRHFDQHVLDFHAAVRSQTTIAKQDLGPNEPIVSDRITPETEAAEPQANQEPEVEQLPSTDDQTQSAPSERAATPRRVALVIGNASYRRVAWLENPDDDARSMADALERIGFKVIRTTDATLSQMVFALQKFSNSLSDHTEVSLVYYSGHAIEIGSANYLLPIDIVPSQAQAEVAQKSLSLSALIATMNSTKTSTKIVILDACRNNPLDSEARGGLAEVRAESGTFIAYSTAPGAIAVDGEPGAANSPFTAALVAALQSPARTIEETFRYVRAEVMRATNNEQVPWESSSLLKEFSFLPPPDLSPLETSYTEDNEELAGMSEDAAIAPKTQIPIPQIGEPQQPDANEQPQLVAEVPEGITQGYPVPKPRPKPIEVLMTAAVNMEIDPSPAPPPDQMVRPKASSLETNAIALVPPAVTLTEPESNVAEKTSLTGELRTGAPEPVPVIDTMTTASAENGNWFQQQPDLEDRKPLRHDVAAPQFSDAPLADLMPNVVPVEVRPITVIGARRSPSQVCLDALNTKRNGWDTQPPYEDDVSEAKMMGLTVHSCRAAIGLPPLAKSMVE